MAVLADSHLFHLEHRYKISCNSETALEDYLKRLFGGTAEEYQSLQSAIQAILSEQYTQDLTALHLAVMRGRVKVVDTIINNLNVKRLNHPESADICRSRERGQLCKFLLDDHFECGSILQCSFDHPDILAIVMMKLTPEERYKDVIQSQRGLVAYLKENKIKTAAVKVIFQSFADETAQCYVIHEVLERICRTEDPTANVDLVLSALSADKRLEILSMTFINRYIHRDSQYDFFWVSNARPKLPSRMLNPLAAAGKVEALKVVNRHLDSEKWVRLVMMENGECLRTAIQHHQADVVEYLLMSLPDMDTRVRLLRARSDRQYTPLEYAISIEEISCIKMALQSVPQNLAEDISRDSFKFFLNGGLKGIVDGNSIHRAIYDVKENFQPIETIVKHLPLENRALMVAKAVSDLQSTEPVEFVSDGLDSVDKTRMVNFLKTKFKAELAIAETNQSGMPRFSYVCV